MGRNWQRHDKPFILTEHAFAALGDHTPAGLRSIAAHLETCAGLAEAGRQVPMFGYLEASQLAHALDVAAADWSRVPTPLREALAEFASAFGERVG